MCKTRWSCRPHSWGGPPLGLLFESVQLQVEVIEVYLSSPQAERLRKWFLRGIARVSQTFVLKFRRKAFSRGSRAPGHILTTVYGEMQDWPQKNKYGVSHRFFTFALARINAMGTFLDGLSNHDSDNAGLVSVSGRAAGPVVVAPPQRRTHRVHSCVHLSWCCAGKAVILLSCLRTYCFDLFFFGQS